MSCSPPIFPLFSSHHCIVYAIFISTGSSGGGSAKKKDCQWATHYLSFHSSHSHQSLLSLFFTGSAVDGLQVVILLKRRIVNELLTTYLPTLLILIIVYSTNFFKDPIWHQLELFVLDKKKHEMIIDYEHAMKKIINCGSNHYCILWKGLSFLHAPLLFLSITCDAYNLLIPIIYMVDVLLVSLFSLKPLLPWTWQLCWSSPPFSSVCQVS